MSLVLVDTPDTSTALVPVEDLHAVIARLERMQSIGAGLLSNAAVALRTLRAHVPTE